MIAEAYSNLIAKESVDEDALANLAVLEANDVDVYYGSFTTRAEVVVSVMLDRVEYKRVEHFQWEINTVKCEGLNADNFLKNNNLNITASCLLVDFTSNDLFSVHVSPCFWEFLFQKNSERII